MQPRLHGRDRDVEARGDGPRRLAVEEAQLDHLAHRIGQRLDRLEHGPQAFRARRHRAGGSDAVLPGRTFLAPRAPRHIAAAPADEVPGDTPKPGSHLADGAVVAQRHQHRLLDDVVGVLAGAGQPANEPSQPVDRVPELGGRRSR